MFPKRVLSPNLKQPAPSEGVPFTAREPYRSGQRKYPHKLLLIRKGSKTPVRLAEEGGSNQTATAQIYKNVLIDLELKTTRCSSATFF